MSLAGKFLEKVVGPAVGVAAYGAARSPDFRQFAGEAIKGGLSNIGDGLNMMGDGLKGALLEVLPYPESGLPAHLQSVSPEDKQRINARIERNHRRYRKAASQFMYPPGSKEDRDLAAQYGFQENSAVIPGYFHNKGEYMRDFSRP